MGSEISMMEGEEVLIGDIENLIGVIRLQEIRGTAVRIGFEFPRDVDVNRREVADRILAKRKKQMERVIGAPSPPPDAQRSYLEYGGIGAYAI